MYRYTHQWTRSIIGICFVGTSSITLCDSSINQWSTSNETSRFCASVQALIPRYAELRGAWDYDNAKSRLPTIMWPEHIADEVDLPTIKTNLTKCIKENGKNRIEKCGDIQFQLAMGLLCLQHREEAVQEGVELMKDLAQHEHPDGLCGYGICLNDRRGVSEDPQAAVQCWQTAIEKHQHVHAAYELGIAYYVGEGVEEDDKKAYELFRQSAEHEHQAAMYMVGDCLFEGIGVQRDRAEALEWFIKAGMKGHRSARSKVLEILERSCSMESQCNDTHLRRRNTSKQSRE